MSILGNFLGTNTKKESMTTYTLTQGQRDELMAAIADDGSENSDLLVMLQHLRVAAPSTSLPAQDVHTWCAYVAGMICTYLDYPLDSDKEKAIAGIIERRMWCLAAPSEIQSQYGSVELQGLILSKLAAPSASTSADGSPIDAYRYLLRIGADEVTRLESKVAGLEKALRWKAELAAPSTSPEPTPAQIDAMIQAGGFRNTGAAREDMRRAFTAAHIKGGE